MATINPPSMAQIQCYYLMVIMKDDSKLDKAAVIKAYLPKQQGRFYRAEIIRSVRIKPHRDILPEQFYALQHLFVTNVTIPLISSDICSEPTRSRCFSSEILKATAPGGNPSRKYGSRWLSSNQNRL